MSSLPVESLPAELAAIVQSSDPETVSLALRLWNMPTDSQIDTLGAAQDVYEHERAEFDKRTSRDKFVMTVLRASLTRKIVDAGGTAIPNEYYDVRIERSKTLQKDIATLKQLHGLVPDDELTKALYIEQPPPIEKADGTKLNALARKYGGEVREIIEKAMQPIYGAPRLIFERRKATLKAVNS